MPAVHGPSQGARQPRGSRPEVGGRAGAGGLNSRSEPYSSAHEARPPVRPSSSKPPERPVHRGVRASGRTVRTPPYCRRSFVAHNLSLAMPLANVTSGPFAFPPGEAFAFPPGKSFTTITAETISTGTSTLIDRDTLVLAEFHRIVKSPARRTISVRSNSARPRPRRGRTRRARGTTTRRACRSPGSGSSEDDPEPSPRAGP
jgi:hypothetical protein